MQFEPGHERMVAMEWLVSRLAVAECLRQPDPIAAVTQMAADAVTYSQLLLHFARSKADSQDAADQQKAAALMIGVELDSLMEAVVSNLVEAVEAK